MSKKQIKPPDQYNKSRLPFCKLPAKVRNKIRTHCLRRLNEVQVYDNGRWHLCRVTRENYHCYFNECCIYRVAPRPLVVITVYGGVAYVHHKPRNIEVKIIDYDAQDEKFR